MSTALSEWVRVAEDAGCNIYIADNDGLHLYSQGGPVVHVVIGDGSVLEVYVTGAPHATHRVARTPDELRALLVRG